jgi:hypothetical protein
MNYFILIDDQQAGPFSVDEISAKLAAGEIDQQTLVGAEGWDTWLPLDQVDGLAIGAMETVTTPPPPGATPAPNPPSDADSGSGLMANIKKGAEIARKQTRLKKLELTDLKSAHTEIGKIVIDQPTPLEAFSDELGQIAELDQQIETLRQLKSDDPNATLADKAKGAAAAAKTKIEREQALSRRRHIVEAIGAHAMAESIDSPGGESAIAQAQTIQTEIASLQAEIDTIGAKAHPLAKHPFLVVGALVALLAIGFFLMRDKTPKLPDYAAAPQEENERMNAKFREEREKQKAESDARREQQQAGFKAREAEMAKQKQANAERNAKRKIERAKETAEKEKSNAAELAARMRAAAKRAQARSITVNPTFLPADFKSTEMLRAFYAQSQPENPENLVDYLLREFSEPGFKRIQAANKADIARIGAGRQMGSAVFAAELNEILRGPLIYNEKWLQKRQRVGRITSDIEFTQETKELLEEVRFGYSRQYIPHLNRLLIENVMPNLVRPTVQIGMARIGPAPADSDVDALIAKLQTQEKEFRKAIRDKQKLSESLKRHFQGKHEKFRKLDSDRSQSVTPDEFLGPNTFLGVVPNRKTRPEQYRKAAVDFLKMYDENGDGKSVFEEFVWSRSLNVTHSQYKSKRPSGTGWGPNSLDRHKDTLAALQRDEEKERAAHKAADTNSDDSLDLPEFTRWLGNEFTERKGNETNRRTWEASQFKSKKKSPLTWHQFWFVRFDLNNNKKVDVDEWTGRKGLTAERLSALNDEVKQLYVYTPMAQEAPKAAPRQYPKVKATLAYAMAKGLVTAKVGRRGDDMYLEVVKSDLIKGMDVYLSLQEGAVLTPKDDKYARIAIYEFSSGDGDRVKSFLGRYDDSQNKDYREKRSWGLKVVQLDLAKPLPKEHVEFTLQTSGVNELGALFYSDVKTSFYSNGEVVLMALAYANPGFQREDLEMHIKTFPKERIPSGFGIVQQPRIDEYLKVTRARTEKFKANKKQFMDKEGARVQKLMQWGVKTKKWNLFTPQLPPAVAQKIAQQ